MENKFDYKDVFTYNETEANQYAARCMVVCAAVGAGSWLLDLVGIFIVPMEIMSVAISVLMVCFLFPILICRITGGVGAWIKYVMLLCSIVGVFVLSCAMPKHGLLAWALPLMLSCHYYSRVLIWLTLVLSQILFSASIFIGMFVGEWDQALLNAAISTGPREITQKLIVDAAFFFALPRAAILLGMSAICITLAKRTRTLLEKQARDSQERERIAAELDVARNIQAEMLPCLFPAFPERKEFEVYATMNPAKEVGGDFYDFFMVDDRHLAVVMADVSGKGVPAALFMVIGKTLLKDHTKPGVRLGRVFEEVNNLLCESNGEGLFITAFEGVLDLVTGQFDFVNAGHEPLFIARKGEGYKPRRLSPGFVLAGMENMKYQEGSIQLAPGDRIFQYTDGVTEATNRKEELYGMERLEASLCRNAEKAPEELLRAVKEDIDRFVGEAPQFDDITMLCVEYREAMQEEKTA
ncbi:MAG: PP2C family protein-serine/threonine phosphatase [Lachnospiraceae bacterium]|jgi:serine phosphatase RsbU (regulator of sigma subunit)|nr:PP2C family protein-serine/threonine phosphatase [Lachnospiraceae bacterium]